MQQGIVSGQAQLGLELLVHEHLRGCGSTSLLSRCKPVPFSRPIGNHAMRSDPGDRLTSLTC
jgi:hypothetical protein